MPADLIPHSRPTLGVEEIKLANKVIKSGNIAMGKQVSCFEAMLRRFLGVNFALAVNSGTSALHLALIALGAKQGREVIIPTYACTALLNAVNLSGASPVITDVDQKSFCLFIRL